MWFGPVLRWVLARWVRQPATWLVVPVLAAAWPIVNAIHPLGITTTRRGETGALYELVFLSALAATLAGQMLLGRAEPLLVSLGTGRRCGVEFVTHLALGALYLLPVLITAWFTQAPRSAFAPTRLPLGAILTLFHLAALAQVLRRLPLPRSLQATALPLLAWALPALVTASVMGVDFLAALDAGRHLELASERQASGPQRIGAGLPIIGWTAVGLLMTRPHPHALRRPR